MTCSKVRWLHLYPYYLLSSLGPAPPWFSTCNRLLTYVLTFYKPTISVLSG
jgi:hypothetical protein